MRDTGHNTRARTYVRADDSSLTGKRPSLVALPALTFSARNAGSAGRFCVSLLYVRVHAGHRLGLNISDDDVP